MNRVIAKQRVVTGIGLVLCVSAISAVAQTNESASVEAAPPAAKVESVPKLVVTGRALLDAFAALADEITDLERDFEARAGEEQLLLGRNVERKKVEILRLIRPILDNMLAQERESFDTRKIRDVMEPALERLHASLERHLDAAEKRIVASREEREGLDFGQLLDLEQRIATELEWKSILLHAYTDYLVQLDLIGIDSPARETSCFSASLLERRISREGWNLQPSVSPRPRSAQSWVRSPLNKSFPPLKLARRTCRRTCRPPCA